MGNRGAPESVLWEIGVLQKVLARVLFLCRVIRKSTLKSTFRSTPISHSTLGSTFRSTPISHSTLRSTFRSTSREFVAGRPDCNTRSAMVLSDPFRARDAETTIFMKYEFWRGSGKEGNLRRIGPKTLIFWWGGEGKVDDNRIRKFCESYYQIFSCHFDSPKPRRRSTDEAEKGVNGSGGAIRIFLPVHGLSAPPTRQPYCHTSAAYLSLLQHDQVDRDSRLPVPDP